MKIKLPHYTTRDYLVLGIILAPITLTINSVIFGSRYWTEWQVFLISTLITAAVFCLVFILCGGIALILKKRFPSEAETGRRLGLIIISFLCITGMFLLALFRGYESITLLGYSFNGSGFIWACTVMGIFNIFITFLMEGIAHFESWKANLDETETLKKIYRQSRLIGLKSQVNPHFLFNSLNCLSCLIQEDQQKGERFLDQMTKVYRYMLQNDEEQLVNLETELKFTDAYLYLLKARYGDGLRVSLEIPEKNKEKLLPPLAFQTIIENILAYNSSSKEHPLDISIRSDSNNDIVITNNIQPRLVTETTESGYGLDNLVKKYELLNQPPVLINGSENERTIRLPLVRKEEVVL